MTFNLLLNEYPYMDTDNVRSILGSIIQLQKTQDESESFLSSNSGEQGWDKGKQSRVDKGRVQGVNYIVDVGTLERICSSAVTVNDLELILLVWDYMDLIRDSLSQRQCTFTHGDRKGDENIKYTPTEDMYESIIQAFCQRDMSDHLALEMLEEMESAEGYVPNWALLQLMSRFIGQSEARTDNFFNMAVWGSATANSSGIITTSTATMNCVLAAYGRMGFVDKAFTRFDEFNSLGYQPNSNTFRLLIELVAKNLADGVAVMTGATKGKRGLFWKRNYENTGICRVITDYSVTKVGGDVKNLIRDGWEYDTWVTNQVESAEAIYLIAKDKEDHHNIDHSSQEEEQAASAPFIQHYVEVLCISGKTEKAVIRVSEILRNGGTVSLRTFNILIDSLMDLGEIDEVEYVTQMCRDAGHTDPLGFELSSK